MVWTLLKDIPAMLAHIPGARFAGTLDAQTHSAALTIPAGPARGTYDLRVAIESIDDTAHTAVVSVTGDDAGGRGSIRGTLSLAVQPAGAGSDIEVRADVAMPGVAAAPGSAGIAGSAPPAFANAANEFASNLERALRH
jgi:carbon monoxide dehydrogenase subunit G